MAEAELVRGERQGAVGDRHASPARRRGQRDRGDAGGIDRRLPDGLRARRRAARLRDLRRPQPRGARRPAGGRHGDRRPPGDHRSRTRWGAWREPADNPLPLHGVERRVGRAAALRPRRRSGGACEPRRRSGPRRHRGDACPPSPYDLRRRPRRPACGEEASSCRVVKDLTTEAERPCDPRRRSRILRPRRVWRRDRHAAPRSASAGGLEVHPGHEHGPLLAEPGGAPHRLLSAGDSSRCAAGRRRPRGASRRGPGNASPVGSAPSRVPENRGLPHLPLGQMACRRIAAGAGI